LRAGDDLEDVFAWKEERTLSQAVTLQYDKVIFILEPSEQAKAAIGKRVTVVDYPDGRLVIRYNGVELAYRTFDKVRQVDQGAIADNKRLKPVLAMIRDEQLRRGPERRSGPRRRDQRDARADPTSSRFGRAARRPSSRATPRASASRRRRGGRVPGGAARRRRRNSLRSTADEIPPKLGSRFTGQRRGVDSPAKIDCSFAGARLQPRQSA
jgi:hypothetical protein